MTIIGWTLFLCGLLIRGVAVKSLGKNLHWRIVYPKDLNKVGVYKLIRHPMYLGGLLDHAGLCLLLSKNYGITIMFFILLFNFTLDRIDREERFLITGFQEKYINYMENTKMLIPFIF